MPEAPLPDPGIYDLFLKAFLSVFSFAWAGLTPQVSWLVSRLAVWCLVPGCIAAAAGLQAFLPPLVGSLLRVAFVAWVVTMHESLLNRFADWMVRIGLYAGQAPAAIVGYMPMTLDEFMSPGTVLYKGFDMMLPVVRYVEDLNWWDIGSILTYDFFVVLPLWICFVAVAANILVAIIEFRIVGLWSLIAIAFATFRGTAFVASSAISGILASGARLGVIALVTGLILPLTFYIAIPANGDDPEIWNVMAAGAGAIFLAVMSLKAPAYASSFFGGGPAFTGATLVSVAVGAVMAGARGVGGLIRR